MIWSAHTPACRIAGGLAAAAVLAAATAPASSATASSATANPASAPLTKPTADWTGFLDDRAHTSFNAAATSIKPGNVKKLVQKWRFGADPSRLRGQPPASFVGSPTVSDGAVFIGSWNGWFYKLSERTGAVLRKRYVGFQRTKTCPGGGFAGTATVAEDPSDGTDTVYIGSPGGFLYALRASDLSVKWRSVIARPSPSVSDYFQWSSPTVANGRIYVGISSNCDRPLVRGGLVGFLQATGREFARYYTVPRGAVGGSVWSSAAVGKRFVFISTGNGGAEQRRAHATTSIVELNGRTLRPLSQFTVPRSQRMSDADFGASPTLFWPLVGACDKNGIFYALRRPSMTVAWERRIAISSGPGDPQCIGSAAYDGKNLYVAARDTTIRGRVFRGSIRALDAVTGQVLWQTGLPNGVFGSPTMDGSGVIAVGTYDFGTRPNAVYLIDARTGRILRAIRSAPTFAQSVFAGARLIMASASGVRAWAITRG